MSDRVHLVVDVEPEFGVHKLVKAIAGRSLRVLREEFPWLTSKLLSLWTNSYFVATVGGAPLSVIKRYVERRRIVESC
jgi:putative transposase